MRHLLYVALLTASMNAQVFGSESDAGTRDIAALIERLARDRSRALIEGDIGALDRILAPAFVYTNASGEMTDKAAYLRRMTNPSVKWISQDLSDVQVRLSGDTAVLTAAVHDRASFDGQPLDAKFRSTFVYVRNPSGWHCVAGHTSPVVDDR
jgi:ketosteroid isomerase-like protein